MKFSKEYEIIYAAFKEIETLLCGGTEQEREGNWHDGDPIGPRNQYRIKLTQSFTNNDRNNLKHDVRFMQDLLEDFKEKTVDEMHQRLIYKGDSLSRLERQEFLYASA
jgi:hypothetical protein